MPLRPATAQDQKTIVEIVHAAGINPTSLQWPRFVVAEEDGSIVGVGQIKPHGDGSRELASIAVIPERQGRGVGSEIVRALLANSTGPLYLTTREALESYYVRFGFRRIDRAEMPRYFRRLLPVINLFLALTRHGVRIIVMKRDGEAA